MTSDAQEKFIPYFVRAKMPGYRGGYVGCLVVIATWVVLYLWGVTQLVDGVLDWLTYGSSSAVVRVAVAVATTTVSTITGLCFGCSADFTAISLMCFSRAGSTRDDEVLLAVRARRSAVLRYHTYRYRPT